MNSCASPGIALSLEQAKALVRVEYEYLFQVLRNFGFPAAFVNYIRHLYRDLRSELVVNGFLSPPFVVTRGMWLGCPLSSMLFVLCIDPLLRQLHTMGQIRGFLLLGQLSETVSTYADDVVLFMFFTACLKCFTFIQFIVSCLVHHWISEKTVLCQLVDILPAMCETRHSIECLGNAYNGTKSVLLPCSSDLLSFVLCRKHKTFASRAFAQSFSRLLSSFYYCVEPNENRQEADLIGLRPSLDQTPTICRTLSCHRRLLDHELTSRRIPCRGTFYWNTQLCFFQQNYTHPIPTNDGERK